MRADQRLLPTDIVDEATRLSTLDQPSLKNLSYILRHRELWPDEFVWNYDDCDTCAMGLAYELWREIRTPTSAGMARVFEIPQRDANRIFGAVVDFWHQRPDVVFGVASMHSVTPEMVADKIDEYLAGRADG